MSLLTRRKPGDEGPAEPVEPAALPADQAQEELELPSVPPIVAVPAVNLLPTTYARRAALARAKAFALAVVGVAAIIVAFGFTVTWQQASEAEARVAAASEQRAALQREANKYSDVPRIFNDVALAQRQLELAMGNEVRWSFFLNDLALTIPSGVSLDTLQVTALGPGGLPSPSGIGKMTVSAKAFSYNTVANWLDSLAKLPTLSDPYLGGIKAGSLEGQEIVTYTSTAAVTERALSQRYTAPEVSP